MFTKRFRRRHNRNQESDQESLSAVKTFDTQTQLAYRFFVAVVERSEEDPAAVPGLALGVALLVDDPVEKFAPLEEFGYEVVIVDRHERVKEVHLNRSLCVQAHKRSCN